MSRARQTAMILLAAAATLAATTTVYAQYDRDGRYVPSPNGVPTDPYAAPIPNYPGTPGGAIGTPVLPRNLTVPPMTPAPLTPRIETDPRTSGGPLRRYEAPRIDAERCRIGWARVTGLTRREFERACNVLLRKEK